MSIGAIFQAAVPVVSGIAGLLTDFLGRSEPEGLAEQRQALSNASFYNRAALNPESPHFRALAALDEAQRKRDIVQAMQSVMKMQNRARARGVVGPMTNPERRDESFASAIANIFAQTGDQSRRGAQSALFGAAGRETQIGQAYQGPVGTANRLEAGNFALRSKGFEELPDVTSGFAEVLGKLFSGGGKQFPGYDDYTGIPKSEFIFK